MLKKKLTEDIHLFCQKPVDSLFYMLQDESEKWQCPIFPPANSEKDHSSLCAHYHCFWRFSSNCHFLQGWTSHQQQNMLHASPLMGFLTSRTPTSFFFLSSRFSLFLFSRLTRSVFHLSNNELFGGKRVLVSFPRHSCMTSTESETVRIFRHSWTPTGSN